MHWPVGHPPGVKQSYFLGNSLGVESPGNPEAVDVKEPGTALEPGHRASRKWLGFSQSSRAQSHLHSRFVTCSEVRARVREGEKAKHWGWWWWWCTTQLGGGGKKVHQERQAEDRAPHSHPREDRQADRGTIRRSKEASGRPSTRPAGQ